MQGTDHKISLKVSSDYPYVEAYFSFVLMNLIKHVCEGWVHGQTHSRVCAQWHWVLWQLNESDLFIVCDKLTRTSYF